MDSILIRLFYVTVLSSLAILLVIAVKAVFKNKIHTKAISLLWALVLFRLLFPFVLQSPVNIANVLPQNNTAPQQVAVSEEVTIDYENGYQNGVAFNNDYANENYNNTTDYADTNNQSAQNQNASPILQNIKAYIKDVDFEYIAVLTWLAVGIAILLKAMFSLAVFSSKLRGANIVSSKLHRAFACAKARVKNSGNVKIVESYNVDMPVTYGLVNPKIVIPAEIVNSLDENKLRLIIMHELTHIHRGDIFRNYLWLLAKAIHWFNPLVWIAYKSYLSDIEIICDKHVIDNIRYIDRAEYSESLLESAKILSTINYKTSPCMLNFCKDKSKLRRRIMNILKPQKHSRKTGLIIIMTAVILLISCFTTACTNGMVNDQPSLQPAEPTALPVTESMDNTVASENTDIENDTETVSTETMSATIAQEPYEIWSETRNVDGYDITVNLNITRYQEPTDNLPTAKTAYKNFSTEQIQKAADYFMGDTYYTNVMTKADFQRQIDNINTTTAGYEVDSEDQRDVDWVLSKLETGMASAPEENEEISLQGIISDVYIEMKSYADDSEVLELLVHNLQNEGSHIYFGRNMEGSQYFSLSRGPAVDDEETELINEYKNIAIDAVESFADNMALKQIEKGMVILCDPKWISFKVAAESDIVEKSYAFYFTPSVEKYAGLYGLSAFDMDKSVGDDFSPFANDSLMVVVDSKGVRMIQWTGQKAIVSAETNIGKPISLDDAISVFKDNIFETKSWHDGETDSAVVNIDTVRLGMASVKTAAGKFDLVPVYAFKGNETFTMDGMEFDRYTELDNAYFMLVNAISGEVIR